MADIRLGVPYPKEHKDTVMTALDQLVGAVSGLEDRVATLVDQLNPVLLPDNPSTETHPEPEIVKSSARAVADKIHVRVNAVSARLGQLLNSLDL